MTWLGESVASPIRVRAYLRAWRSQMALLGQGIFVAWHDVADGSTAKYDRWHSHEHMLERVSIPGFLRGRRYTVVEQGPHYLVVYETADVGVFTAPAYLERLNNPTPMTREVMPTLRNMNRSEE